MSELVAGLPRPAPFPFVGITLTAGVAALILRRIQRLQWHLLVQRVHIYLRFVQG
jgi:hypothetical protein